MNYTIDTNVYVALMKGDKGVFDKLRHARKVAVPAAVVGELVYGFRYGNRYEENRRQLETFLREDFVEFLPIDLATCDRFGVVAANVRQKGTPIPQNDIWIAAQALQSGTELLSFDAHFNAVDGLLFTHLGY